MIASEAAVKNREDVPVSTVKPEQVHQLKSQGMSWRRIAKGARNWDGDCDASVQVD